MAKVAQLALGAYYALVITFPLLVFAQAGIPARIVPCDGIDCEVCHLATLAQNLLNAGIFIFIFIAAMLFAYAGFLYLTNEAIGEQQRARSIFKNVAIGLVILLSAWLIIDTLMKTVLKGDFGPWNDVCAVLPR
ncbi:MAG TPA: hypothetical protein VNM40_00285 [Candidatus Paceibacterota bacterium]|nr:hypothetical protein [Candidatus Paceibacterota bacterium]